PVAAECDSGVLRGGRTGRKGRPGEAGFRGPAAAPPALDRSHARGLRPEQPEADTARPVFVAGVGTTSREGTRPGAGPGNAYVPQSGGQTRPGSRPGRRDPRVGYRKTHSRRVPPALRPPRAETDGAGGAALVGSPVVPGRIVRRDPATGHYPRDRSIEPNRRRG